MSDRNRFSVSNRSGRSDFTVASAGALFVRRLVTINIGPLRGSIISAHQTTMNQRFALLLMPIVLVSSFTASGQSATQTSGSLDSRVRAEITPFKGKVFLHAKNLDTGQTYSYNGDERVRTASTIKIAIMIEVWSRVAEIGRAHV